MVIAVSIRRTPRRSAVGIATTLLPLLLARPSSALVECDAGALCPRDPCTITRSHQFEQDCNLDFRGKDVTVARSARLAWPLPDTAVYITARNLTLEGSITGVGTYASIVVDENFHMSRPGVISMRGRGPFTTVVIEAGGSVVLGGSIIYVTGGGAAVYVQATDILVASRIATAGRTEDGAQIYLGAYGGSITATGRVSARGTGFDAAGFVSMEADGDIAVRGPVRITGGPGSGGHGVDISAGGSVIVDRITLTHPNSGGGVFVDAFGDTVVGDVRARGRAASGRGERFGEGGEVALFAGPSGTLRVMGLVDASCAGGIHCFPGFIGLGAGCYTDLTGATLRAGPDSFGFPLIRLECPCVHMGETCDGGCAGLDQATLDPPLATELQPCP